MQEILSPSVLFHHTIDGVTWEYYAIGKGKKTLVILPNILAFPQQWEDFIKNISREYRVIIPLYRVTRDRESLVMAVHALLLHITGEEKVTLIGNSFGGILAQTYALLYPKKVEKLILVASIAPSRVYGFLANCLYWISFFLPTSVIPSVVCLGMWVSLSQDQQERIGDRLQEHIMNFCTKDYIRFCGKCIIDFCWQSPHVFSLNPAVIVEGQGDIVFPFFVKNLHKTYPKAPYYEIKNGKHLVEINKSTEVLAILTATLTQ